MADKVHTDVMNNAIALAGELGFRAVQTFLAQNPNPPGQLPIQEVPAKLTNADLRRLIHGR